MATRSNVIALAPWLRSPAHLGKVVVEASELQLCEVVCQPAGVTLCKYSESAQTESCFLQLMELFIVAGYYVPTFFRAVFKNCVFASVGHSRDLLGVVMNKPQCYYSLTCASLQFLSYPWDILERKKMPGLF